MISNRSKANGKAMKKSRLIENVSTGVFDALAGPEKVISTQPENKMISSLVRVGRGAESTGGSWGRSLC